MSIRQTVAAALALATIAAFAEKRPYSRYEPIVERQMFGPLPEGFDPTKMPSEVARSSGGKQGKELTKEQEKLQSAIHFSAINVTPDGATAVGFTDNSNPKTPVHYYLKVGESRDGWKVETADAKTATMTIVKDDIEVSLTLGGNSGKGGGTVAKRAQDPATITGAGASLGGRRNMHRKRDAAEREARAAAEKAEREARAAADEAREAQRAADREEYRQQLMAIQEEFRKVHEAKESARGGADNENDNSE